MATPARTRKTTLETSHEHTKPDADVFNEGRTSFDRMRPALLALDPARVRRINADIPTVVGRALAAVPVVTPLRAQLAAALPQHPIACVDELQTAALATWYLYLAASERDGGALLKPLLDEGFALRARLQRAADALVDGGLLDADKVAEIQKPQGTRNADLAHDLSAYAMLFQAAWPVIASKTALAPDDLQRATQLGLQILTAIGARRSPAASTPASDDMLARAFTILVGHHEQCRRALHYLRWDEDDADAMVPSLFRQASGRRKASDAEDEGEDEDEGGDAPEGPAPA